MFLTEHSFKEKYTLRKSTGSPARSTTLSEDIPKDPIYHFISDDESLGPAPTDLVMSAISSVDEDLAIYVGHVTDTLGLKNESFDVPKLKVEKTLIQDYHKRWRQFNRVFDIDRVLSKHKPLVINYNMIDQLYPIKRRRPDTFKERTLLKWEVLLKTASNLDTERVQFISVNAPRTLKPFEYYKRLIEFGNVTEMRKIKNSEDILLLDFLAAYTQLGEDSITRKYLETIQNTIFAIRDGVNVVYLKKEDFLEWSSDDADAQKNLKWMFGIFEFLIDKRVAAEELIDGTYADEVVRIKEDIKPDTNVDNDYAAAITDVADELLESGAISEGEYRGNVKLASRFKTVDNPFGEGTLEDLVKPDMEGLFNVDVNTVPDIKHVEDKSLLNNTVARMDAEYIEKHYRADQFAHIMMLQNQGLSVLNVKVENIKDAANDREIISIQTKPVKGDIGTIKLDIPRLHKNGTFLSGGVTYRMSKQRGEEPIVKIARDTVALTSAMNKMFVRRGTRKTNNYPQWILPQLFELEEDKVITKLIVTNVFDMSAEVPMVYSTIALRITSFEVGDLKLNFDYSKRESLAGDHLKSVERFGTFVGSNKAGLVVVDDSNVFSNIIAGKVVTIGTLEEILGLNVDKKPHEYSEIKIKGKVIPVGVLLAYWMGLENFLKYIGVSYTEYEKNKRISEVGGYTITCKSEKIHVQIDTPTQALLIHGFKYFDKGFREVQLDSLSRRTGFIGALSTRGIGNSQNMEYNIIRRGWIEPTTRKLLQRMKEPTNMRDLLIRATELLTNDQNVGEVDGAFKVNKGYSRFNEIIYRELMQATRELERGNKTAKRKLSLNPNAVKMAILQDAGISPVEQSNPLQVSGEMDRITYSGAGGRSSQSMMGRHRQFSKSDIGVISEGHTDNGKAGTILYYSANPNIDSYYGTSPTEKKKEMGNMVSSCFGLSPFAIHDDAKRTNFARIQGDSIANADGYQMMPIRTGGEMSFAHRAGDMFAFPSLHDGVVTEVTDESITVRYSGTGEKLEKSFVLGKVFGTSAGKTIPHLLITDRKKGYKFKAGEILAWNKYYFCRDWLDNTQASMYTGTPAITVLRETQDTYEDSSSVSAAFSKRMGSDVTHIRDILVDFKDVVALDVTTDDEVYFDTKLARILPPGLEFGNSESDGLDYLSQATPVAKYAGHIDRIEVYYCGDKSEASDGVKKIIRAGDSRRKSTALMEDKSPTGEILEPTYIGQNYVGRNNCLIRVYITHKDIMGVGDKSAFCNALKTVHGKIYNTTYRTVSGLDIDAEFSYKGVMARVVKSPEYLGVINMVVRQIGLNAAAIYRKG